MVTPVMQVAKVVGIPLAGKLLGKVDKRFDKFFDNAVTKGFSLDQAMGYLVDRFAGKSSLENELAGRASQDQRPDEMAALQQVQQSKLPARAGQAALAYGLPFALGGGEKETPMEKEGEAGAAIQKGQAQPQAQEPGGFLEFKKQNPELGRFLDTEIKKGTAPRGAALAAKKKRQFLEPIGSIEQNVGQPFEDLLDYLFQGGRQGGQQQSPQGQPPPQGQPQNQPSARMSQLSALLSHVIQMRKGAM